MKVYLEAAACFALAANVCAQGIDRIPLADFAQPMEWNDVTLSPDGKYLAGSFVEPGGKTLLTIVNIKTMERVAVAGLRDAQQVNSIDWVNDERLLFSGADQFGTLAQPQPSGEIFGIGVDEKSPTALFGFRASGMQTGTYIKQKAENAAGFLFDTLPSDPDHVLISVWSFGGSQYSEARKMNVKTGRTQVLLRGVMPMSAYKADHSGVIRLQWGLDLQNRQLMRYCADEDADWEVINDQNSSGEVWSVLGFSADNQRLFLQVSASGGPDSIISYDLKAKKGKQVFRHLFASPSRYVYGLRDRAPIGVVVQPGARTIEFFEPNHPDVALYSRLKAAFPGHIATITSTSDDGGLVIVQVESSTNSGDYYLFNTRTSKADFLVSRAQLMDPELLSPTTPITVKARDGLALRGFLTFPRRVKDKKNLPMIVMPHGGPFGVFDEWRFDPWVQVLADHGYAVLQVNFRGSGGYGHDFEQAGYRQWGGKMQDDLTDATRFAIKEGYADPKRICLAGASYGGYAALMGLVREPELYQCAMSYVGVSDLALMYSRGDLSDQVFSVNYMKETIGNDDAALDKLSPVKLAASIKAPVFLAHGRVDRRVPIVHAESMKSALEKAGQSVEYLAVSGEGHGFYKPANNLILYRKQLEFFAKHIGGEKAK